MPGGPSPPPAGPLARKQPQPPIAAGPLHDVRLHIRWKSHGEKLVLEQTRASLRSIQDTALIWVRRHASTFANVTNFDIIPSRLSTLRAHVRQATIDGDNYDMSSYDSDDLRKLMRVAGVSNIPRFEIDIEALPPGPPAGLRPMGMRPGGSPAQPSPMFG